MHIETARRACQQFRQLHERGCFVMPNPWDAGSARFLQSLGFPALASTSAGFAFSQGLPDSDVTVPRATVLAHLTALVDAVDVPVNADFASGYGVDPAAVADSVALCVATGVAGLSVEDATGDADAPLYELPLAIERVAAARQAIDASGSGVLLTARAECFLVGHPDPLRESLRRLQAYADAGADVLYAPGVATPDAIKVLVDGVAPRPFNLLVGRDAPFNVAEAAAWGVRRVSVGGSLARVAWTGFMQAARQLADGRFDGLGELVSHRELNDFFSREQARRQTHR